MRYPRAFGVPDPRRRGSPRSSLLKVRPPRLAGAATPQLREVVATALREPQARIPVGDVVACDVIQLVTERKHLTDVIERVAHPAGIDLVRRFTPRYRADDEARTLVQSALANAGDIAVTAAELRATFVPLSSPHRTAALAACCAAPHRRCPAAPLVRQPQPAAELTPVRDETWGVARRAEHPRRVGSSPRPVVAVLDAASRSTLRRTAAQRLADQ
jgi:hypothetical protein